MIITLVKYNICIWNCGLRNGNPHVMVNNIECTKTCYRYNYNKSEMFTKTIDDIKFGDDWDHHNNKMSCFYIELWALACKFSCDIK